VTPCKKPSGSLSLAGRAGEGVFLNPNFLMNDDRLTVAACSNGIPGEIAILSVQNSFI
jgi:hypothetical protein